MVPSTGFLVTEARDDLDQTLTLFNAITVEYQLRTQWSVLWLAAGAENFHLCFALRQQSELTFACWCDLSLFTNVSCSLVHINSLRSSL